MRTVAIRERVAIPVGPEAPSTGDECGEASGWPPRPPARLAHAMRNENVFVPALEPDPTVIEPRPTMPDDPFGTSSRHVAKPFLVVPRPLIGRPFTTALHVATAAVSG